MKLVRYYKIPLFYCLFTDRKITFKKSNWFWEKFSNSSWLF